MVISFYLENNDQDYETVKSVIKFGSMDLQGLKDDTKTENGKTKMRNIKTKNTGTWDLDLELMKLNIPALAENYTLRLEPQLPYVYLPPAIFETFA